MPANRKRREPKPLRGECADLWHDSDLMNLGTMNARSVYDSMMLSMQNATMVSASTGAALLANAMFEHVKGCDDPQCRDCREHFRSVDFRKLAHEVLDMHLNRAVIIGTEAQGSA